MTNEYQKILDWCDRQQVISRLAHGCFVHAQHSGLNGSSHTLWTAHAQYFDRTWRTVEITTDSTPEEAIAKLAEALGL